MILNNKKKGFFERLAGTISSEDDEPKSIAVKSELPVGQDDDDSNEGELAVDVYQTDNEIIIEAMIAGVSPDNLNVTITRDLVTIIDKREPNTHVINEDYFIRELFWGSFSREIELPVEVDPNESEAIEKHGLLIIRLPKINKARQTKIRVKSI